MCLCVRARIRMRAGGFRRHIHDTGSVKPDVIPTIPGHNLYDSTGDSTKKKKPSQTKDRARVTPNYQHWRERPSPPSSYVQKNGDRNGKIKTLLFIYDTRGGFWLVRKKIELMMEMETHLPNKSLGSKH